MLTGLVNYGGGSTVTTPLVKVSKRKRRDAETLDVIVDKDQRFDLINFKVNL